MSLVPEVSRSPLSVKHNTLPKSAIGKWLSSAFILEFRVKPAIDNTLVMVEVCPLFLVVDAHTRRELYRFQTESTFSFTGAHSTSYIYGLIHHLVNMSIDEFNAALRKTESLLAVHRSFEKMTFEEFEPELKKAIAINSNRPEVTPHWKSGPGTAIENDQILQKLPAIPECKQFLGPATAEQVAMSSCLKTETTSGHSLEILRECTAFYKKCLPLLKRIDLTRLTDDQYDILKSYAKQLFNALPVMFNDVEIDSVYRVTTIVDEFLDQGKLRNTAFLSYPPLNVVKKRGIYNRANGPDRTIFYCSTQENVALREAKPAQGKRIIISTWRNKNKKLLNVFPLCLTPGIPNEYTNRNTYAFEKLCEKMPAEVAEWMETILTFLSSEFIKETEPVHAKRYDYVYSAWFGDFLLQPFSAGSELPNIDCIVYPSVAWEHRPDNFAMLPGVVDTHFRLVQAKEFVVGATWYQKEIPLDQYPASLQLVRYSSAITGDQIIWNDD